MFFGLVCVSCVVFLLEVSRIYLSGCVFYLLLREAAYSGKSARQRKDGVKDSHRNPIFMADLVYTFTGYKTAGAPSDTSKYREGKIEGTVNLPFDELSTIAAYDNVIRSRYQDALDRMLEFSAWHLNPDKREWLIKALLDVVLNDEDIQEEDMFCLSTDGAFISKKNMRNAEVFEYQPFLIGILHYILTKRAGKNSLGVPTLQAITAKDKGQERRYIGHLGEKLNASVVLYGEVRASSEKDVPVIFHKKGISEKDRRIIQTLSDKYYQLIVTCAEDVFDGDDVVFVSADRALESVPPDISEMCSSLTDKCIEELKTFPAIICRENTGKHGETDPDQKAVYGYITRVMKVGRDIQIAFKPIETFHQYKICTRKTAIYFDLNIDHGFESLKHCAWTVHKVNLFEAFDEAGLTDMPRPTPQGGGSYY